MPELSLSNLAVDIEATPGIPVGDRWHIAWTIENRSLAMLSLHEMRIPHDQFHAEDLPFAPPIEIPSGASVGISTAVLFAEPPRSTLTYPFVIIRATWNGLPCRLFVRLHVDSDQDGAPHAICEEVTVLPIAGGR